MRTLKRCAVRTLYAVLLLASLPGLLPAVESAFTSTATTTVHGGKQTVEDVIPLTMGNLRGHKMLYNEGWTIVTSSRRALEYAKKHSVTRSGDALADAAASAAGRTKDYKTTISSDAKEAVEGGKSVVETGTELTGDIFKATHRAGKAELAYSSESFRKAGEAFIQGNLSLGKRTAEDRKELSSLPGNYFTDLKDDFSNIWELTSAANDKFAG